MKTAYNYAVAFAKLWDLRAEHPRDSTEYVKWLSWERKHARFSAIRNAIGKIERKLKSIPVVERMKKEEKLQPLAEGWIKGGRKPAPTLPRPTSKPAGQKPEEKVKDEHRELVETMLRANEEIFQNTVRQKEPDPLVGEFLEKMERDKKMRKLTIVCATTPSRHANVRDVEHGQNLLGTDAVAVISGELCPLATKCGWCDDLRTRMLSRRVSEDH